MMPGQYVAIVKFESENPDYCGDWIEPFSIIRIPVEKPTPAALTFECEDWETGEGVLQDAFPDLDETWYEFVPDATADDGSVSLRSARAAGSYQACFRLKYPETHEWAGESEETKEVWVPWTIALQEFDPGAPEVTYWGTAYDNTTTTVDYTGEPVWVRPWWTQAKDTDGRFPEWFTHWDSDIDRPTTNRLSSAVFYLEGDDDSEGLVGYHTNADGSFEKVTAEQVYAWVFGVDVGDEHLTVESGDKVWYRTDDDGWKVPLGVGEDQAEGAEGYVVARDYAYADRLGVKDPGTYMAYIAFDDGTGFASTSQAETTVVVREEQSVSERFTAAVNAVPGNKAGEGKGQVDAATAIYETMTEEEKALISPETMDLYNEELAAFTKGRQFRSGDDYYKVLSNGDVTYLKPASRDIRDVKVPNQVKKGKFYFKVIKVSNNAFRDCRNLEWAVISRDVYVFGQNIFAGDGDLKKVRVLGTGFRSGKVTDAFEGTGKNLTVKVPGDKVDEYQELFKNEGRLKGKVVAAS
jgi:hypothetical protein